MTFGKYKGDVQSSSKVATELQTTKTKVAPHKNNEVQLILDNKKPFAVLTVVDNDEQFFKACKNTHKLDVRVLGYSHDKGVEISVEKLGHGARGYHKYLWLLDSKVRLLRRPNGKLHFNTAMGRLFGYSEEEIDAFNASDTSKTCTCKLCN